MSLCRTFRLTDRLPHYRTYFLEITCASLTFLLSISPMTDWLTDCNTILLNDSLSHFLTDWPIASPSNLLIILLSISLCDFVTTSLFASLLDWLNDRLSYSLPLILLSYNWLIICLTVWLKDLLNFSLTNRLTNFITNYFKACTHNLMMLVYQYILNTMWARRWRADDRTHDRHVIYTRIWTSITVE